MKSLLRQHFSFLLVAAMLASLASAMTLTAAATFANTGYVSGSVKTDATGLTGLTVHYDVTGSAVACPARISINTVSFEKRDLMDTGNYCKDHPKLTDWVSTPPDCGFVAWAQIDGKATYTRASSGHTEEVTITLPSGAVPLTDGQQYTVILWAKYGGRIYPDAQLCLFTSGKGEFKASSSSSSSSAAMVSNSDWNALQKAYQSLVTLYNQIADAYNSDQIAADKDIEKAMNAAHDLITQMGKIEKSSLTAADAEDLAEAMVDTAEALSAIASAITAADAAYDALVSRYNKTADAYNAMLTKLQAAGLDQDADVTKSMNECTKAINSMKAQIKSGMSEATIKACNEALDAVEQLIADIEKELASTNSANPFVDVKTTDSFYEAVLWAKEKGITGGTSPTTFSPNNTVTRGQAVTFLWRAKGEPEPKSLSNPFTDVSSSKYYYKAILWAVEQGITNGTSPTTFSPDGTCTNNHILTFIWRNSGKPAASDSSDFERAISWAQSAGMVGSGVVGKNNCPRGSVVEYLWKQAQNPTASTAPTAPTEAVGMVSDADWSTLQTNFQVLLSDYNAVADVYNSDQIAADKNIETAMSAAYDLITQMGQLTRDGLTAADAVTLNEAMVETQNLLVQIISAMQAA